MFETAPRISRPTLLIGSYTEPADRDNATSLLEELDELVRTLGVPIADRMLVFHRELHARYLLGSGKAEEICERVKAEQLGALIFDHDLSPSQQRNWEELAGVPVLDRQKVILDIFGNRARSREARLQIELAQIEYSLPRLTRAWGHLGGQGGGIGGKGEGESQLEQDRRRMWKASDRLKRELEQIKSARATQRKDRQRTPVPNCAIVGYTNVGKSSLLRRLTGADVLIENKLFATLEEAAQADFLVHLLDASAPEVMEFFSTTMKVLAELGADKRPMLVVFNKTDKVSDPAILNGLRTHFPDALFISVQTGEGLDALLEKMSELASPGTLTLNLRLPASEAGLIARLHREAQVHEITYDGADTLMTVTLPVRLTRDCAHFMQKEDAPHLSAPAAVHSTATRKRKTGGRSPKKA